MISRLALVLVAAVCLGGSRLAAQSAVPADSTTADFDTTSAFAYCEYDSTRIVIRDYGHAEIHGKTRLRILRESGLAHAVVVLYDNSFSKLDSFEGRVLGSDGTVILKRSKKDLYKECGFGESYVLYQDICTYTTNLSGGNFPFTIEYSYKRTLNSLFFWQDWQPQQEIPVLSGSYVVDAPPDFEYASKLIPASLAPRTDKLTTSERIVTRWSATEIPALKPPPLSPPDFDLACRLEFAPQSAKLADYPLDVTSWTALARSNYGLFRDALKIGDETAAVARQLLGGSAPSLQQLAALHDFLMSRQRYIAVSIGVGGWQPHNCNLTYRNRYGDCKDLSTLYAAMLSVAGVEARVALARTKDLGQIDPDFPSLANFNHVIVMVLHGADTVWVDPTCSACAYNDLPAIVEGTFVLVVDPERGALVRTPISAPKENCIVRNIKMALSTDNSAQTTIELTARGNPGHSYKQAARDLTTEELGQFLQSRNVIPASLKVERLDFDKLDSAFSRFSCRITGIIRRAALKLEGRLHLKATFAESPILTDFADLDSRTYPLLLGSPLSIIDTITVTPPDGWHFAGALTNQSPASQFGALAVVVDSTATATLARAHTRIATMIATADFAAFADFQSQCKHALTTTLVFELR